MPALHMPWPPDKILLEISSTANGGLGIAPTTMARTENAREALFPIGQLQQPRTLPLSGSVT